MNWLRTIIEMDEEDLTVEIMELNGGGRAHGTGRFEKLATDTVILAVGQETDTGFLHAVPGIVFDRDVVRVDPDTLMTNVPGIFAGGDVMSNKRIVTTSVGRGKKATRCVDKWLNLDVVPRNPKHPLVHLDQMNLWYFDSHARQVQTEQTPETHVSDFDKVVAGLSPKEVEFEARRCLSCGDCFECDGCYSAYPEDAVTKLGPGNRYRFNYERCTGCTTCYG